MIIQEYYKFKKNEFDENGVHIKTQKWFMDLIKEFEEDFHNRFPHCFANHLFASSSTMLLINKAMNLDFNESCGMDLIDGEVDMEVNMEIENHSEMTTVYAIGSKLEENEEEPIFLISNDEISDELIVLKYIPDDDDSEDADDLIPVTENDMVELGFR